MRGYRLLYLLAITGSFIFGAQRLFFEGFGYLMLPHIDSWESTMHMFLADTLIIPCLLLSFYWPRSSGAALVVAALFSLSMGGISGHVTNRWDVAKTAIPLIVIGIILFAGNRNVFIPKKNKYQSTTSKGFLVASCLLAAMALPIGVILGVLWNNCLAVAIWEFPSQAGSIAIALEFTLVIGIALIVAFSVGMLSYKIMRGFNE